ncbi:putative membrane protein DUF2306 [Mucilaginibacter yixingensis]|uniref:Putative membrane protein DUF2306 n=1 Tax=Mucilaginibacter yixingensis TaxID=1295612 RepID=A0A2T5JE18_9SPHI|nr:DUF2306 domain-containing protein [Mucilaginibacter yixingensis]PTR00018.1 putative membrane protein DUF2306 [Mucilaginibacter yixingensis]
MRITGILLRALAFVWILPLSISTYQYLNFKNDEGFLQLKQMAVKTGWYLPAFYAHIWGSSLILLAGFFQFSRWVYQHKKLHRLLGKIYVFGVLFFASPGGFVMTWFIHRGPGVFLSFLLQNMLWVFFTSAAWVLVLRGDIQGHIKMMNRSYALAFAAVTLRFYIWMLHQMGVGVAFDNNYLIIAFASWVPNLLLVEWLNRYRMMGVAFAGQIGN